MREIIEFKRLSDLPWQSLDLSPGPSVTKALELHLCYSPALLEVQNSPLFAVQVLAGDFN